MAEQILLNIFLVNMETQKYLLICTRWTANITQSPNFIPRLSYDSKSFAHSFCFPPKPNTHSWSSIYLPDHIFLPYLVYQNSLSSSLHEYPSFSPQRILPSIPWRTSRIPVTFIFHTRSYLYYPLCPFAVSEEPVSTHAQGWFFNICVFKMISYFFRDNLGVLFFVLLLFLFALHSFPYWLYLPIYISLYCKIQVLREKYHQLFHFSIFHLPFKWL